MRGPSRIATVGLTGLAAVLIGACQASSGAGPASPAPGVPAQGSGPLSGSPTPAGPTGVKTEVRQASGFDAVKLAAPGELSVVQGDGFALTVTAAPDVLPKLTSEVTGGVLDLGVAPATTFTTDLPIRFQVTMPRVRALSILGSGDLVAAGVTTDRLDLSLSGSGGATIGQLSSDLLSVEEAGSGTATVAGTAREQRVTLTGSGGYAAQDLATKVASVILSGSGRAAVRVSDSLDAVVAGSGSLSYYGSPSVTQQVLGSGSVSRAG